MLDNGYNLNQDKILTFRHICEVLKNYFNIPLLLY